MPIFQVERVEATYCIFVGNDILRAIFDRDCKDEDEKTLLDRLELLDCRRVEWEPMFGPYVWVTIEKEDDTTITMQKIMECISNYAKGE